MYIYVLYIFYIQKKRIYTAIYWEDIMGKDGNKPILDINLSNT